MYRLLEHREILQEGDEWWCEADRTWEAVSYPGDAKHISTPCRRRIEEPQPAKQEALFHAVVVAEAISTVALVVPFEKLAETAESKARVYGKDYYVISVLGRVTPLPTPVEWIWAKGENPLDKKNYREEE